MAGLDREAERLLSESDIARQELETLGLQRGQVKLSFESVTERLKRLEAENDPDVKAASTKLRAC